MAEPTMLFMAKLRFLGDFRRLSIPGVYFPGVYFYFERPSDFLAGSLRWIPGVYFPRRLFSRAACRGMPKCRGAIYTT